MTFHALRKQVQTNVFTMLDVLKAFPQEKEHTVRVQLSRFVKKGYIHPIIRSWYCFDPATVDEFELSSRLYQPSYVSCETALNYYGLIPDIPQAVTGITITTTKSIVSRFGRFYYTKVQPSLFFGFHKIQSPHSPLFFNIAQKEKALLDFFYVRKVQSVSDLRLDAAILNRTRYHHYKNFFPAWVQRIRL